MNRKLLLIAPATTIFIAFFYLLAKNDGFVFFLWLFASAIATLITYPTVFNLNDKTVPVIQIFGSMAIFGIFFSGATFFDLVNFNLSISASILLSLGIGLVALSLFMLIQGIIEG